MSVQTIPDPVRGRSASMIDAVHRELDTSGELRLIAAMIATALTDAKRGNLEAAGWLASDQAAHWICYVTPAELEPENVQSALVEASGIPRELIDMQPPSEPSRRENTCVVCGSVFESRRWDALTCSQSCRSRRARVRTAAGI